MLLGSLCALVPYALRGDLLLLDEWMDTKERLTVCAAGQGGCRAGGGRAGGGGDAAQGGAAGARVGQDAAAGAPGPGGMAPGGMLWWHA